MLLLLLLATKAARDSSRSTRTVVVGEDAAEGEAAEGGMLAEVARKPIH